ncbi:MAG: hypothetical protein ACLFRV_10905 [Acidimicrobiales bacterium]
MSPVERRSSSATTTAVLVGIAGVVAGLGLVILIVNLASEGGDNFEINLGDQRFQAGSADSRAASIAEDGPVLFPDVAGGSRDLILQHLGDESDEGWHAFSAQPAGKGRDCVLDWDDSAGDFVDCDGERYPADGDDPALTRYPVEIEGDTLVIDINFEFRDDADDTGNEDEEPEE